MAESVFLQEDGNSVVIDLETNQVVDWGVQMTGAPDAWKVTRGEGIKVGILDTGGTHHKDVAANVVQIVGDDDNEGHGTHVAGIIGAVDNGIGVVGVAPACRLHMYKTMPGDSGSIRAMLEAAAADGVQVINMSLGAYGDDPGLHAVIKQLYAVGIVMVAAAGNDPTRECYPALYPEVLAVSAIDTDGRTAVFAPMIPNHIAMPGVNILSTWLNNQYARLSGTSMATPLMTGAIALMLSHYKPQPSEVHAVIERELTRIDAENPYMWYTPKLGMLQI